MIENEFDVAATPAEVYALMLDPERVATCIQGAEVTGKNDDGSYDAQVTVKLGPVKMTYRARSRSSRAIPRRAPRACSRRAPRSAVRARRRRRCNMAVTEREGGSHVNVSADMLMTGRVAQMGRGVMQDVARRMIGQMAQNMEALLDGRRAGRG